MTRSTLLLGFILVAYSNPGRGTDTGSTTPPPVTNGHDWTRFNYDEARSGSSPDAIGLTAAVITSGPMLS